MKSNFKTGLARRYYWVDEVAFKPHRPIQDRDTEA